MPISTWIRRPDYSRLSRSGRRREMPSAASNRLQQVMDRRQHGDATSVFSPHRFLWNGLGAIARVGLALFLSTGLACALGLYAGLPADSPTFVQACGCFFTWCLILLLASEST